MEALVAIKLAKWLLGIAGGLVAITRVLMGTGGVALLRLFGMFAALIGGTAAITGGLAGGALLGGTTSMGPEPDIYGTDGKLTPYGKGLIAGKPLPKHQSWVGKKWHDLKSWWGGSSGGDLGSASTEVLKRDRARIAQELKDNPALWNKVMAIAAGENNNPKANLGVIETMMNRAAMLGTTLAAQATLHRNGGYYAGYNPDALKDPKTRAMIDRNMKLALGGSNVANYATDNASNGYNMFAQREQDAGKFILQRKYNGEFLFSPGTDGSKGSRTRGYYVGWRRHLAAMNNAIWSKGTDPFHNYLPLMASPSISNSNDRNVSMNQKTDINVMGSGDPSLTARMVLDYQNGVNGQLLRNTQGAFR